MKSANKNAFGEVKALKVIDDFVDSGLFKDPKLGKRAVPVVIMIKKLGVPLSETTQWTKANQETKLQLTQEIIQKMCTQVAKWATTKDILYEYDLTCAFPLPILMSFEAIMTISITSLSRSLASVLHKV